MLSFFRSWLKVSPLLVLALVALAACGTSSAASTTSSTDINADTNGFHFNLVPSPGITACLPKASGKGTISNVKQNGEVLNQVLTISVQNLAKNAGYDLFVTEIPNKPFGIAWYQSDLQTDSNGNGSVQVRGIFNEETFSVSTGG